MNRKQKKELRQHQTTRQLMGIEQLTEHGIKTARGELIFYLIKPDNLSIQSDEGVRSRVLALTNLLCSTDDLYLLALDSRESFQQNKSYYRDRLDKEEIPALRKLLQQDMAYLDAIQASTASSREFALVHFIEKTANADPGYAVRLEKSIRDFGFYVRKATEQDIMRLLAVYYQQDITTEVFEHYDGERWFARNGI